MSDSAPPFSITQRVYYQHTDAGGVAYHGTYLDFMEAARTEFLHAKGFDLAELAARDAVMFIVRGLRVDYRRPGRLNNLLTVTAEVAKVGFATLDFHQQVLVQSELLVTGHIELGCVDPRTMRPARMPRAIKRALG